MPAEILWPSTKVGHAKIMNRVLELVQRVAEAGPETTQPHLHFGLKLEKLRRSHVLAIQFDGDRFDSFVPDHRRGLIN